MKTKTFDCVAMKRIGAGKVHRRIKRMSLRQQLAFWRRETEAMRQEQQAAKRR
jgi:hypothetical protein